MLSKELSLSMSACRHFRGFHSWPIASYSMQNHLFCCFSAVLPTELQRPLAYVLANLRIYALF